MKKILVTIFVGLCLVFLTKITFAQTSNQATDSGQTVSPTPTTTSGSSTTGNLTFPIAELGNCASASDCKTYCDDPTNIAACVDYAKKKGFYHESSIDTDQAAILADAKATLGCDSVDSCKAFCADSANADACSVFAKKHNLQGGNEPPSNITLEKAKEVLGCNSVDSCRAFCDDAQNKDKCAEFAKDYGLKGGNEKVGPGGCTTESSCKVFCSDPNNFSLCQRFAASYAGSSSGQRKFVGPGGCTTEESCRAFCTQNPTACHMPPLSGTPRPGGPTGFNPDNPVPTTMSPADYCRLYPSHCVGLTPTYFPTPTHSSILTPLPTTTYEVYCESKGPGCTMHETTCICPTPAPTHTASSGSPTSTGAVQGISTQRNFFQWFVETFFHLR